MFKLNSVGNFLYLIEYDRLVVDVFLLTMQTHV
jgi:hypothetical protein